MARSYHHLTEEQRCQLYILKKREDSISKIAQELGVHRSTIYREIARNSGLRGYRFKQAHETAIKRQSSISRSPKKMHPLLLSMIDEKLRLGWSPEQIAGRLRQKQGQAVISHESIYRYIWRDKKSGGDLFKYLRHRGKKYNKRGSSKAGRGCIPHRVDIDQRPSIVEQKLRVGDWELDTIIGKGHKGAIVSIVDRASKLVKLKKVPNKTAAMVGKAIVDKLSDCKELVLTLTADNGKEFSEHQKVSDTLSSSFFFATPYHSWERGLNEHTNGLVRQYFPKSMGFDNITQKQVDEVEKLINNRPRKVLQYLTPVEAFEKLCRQTPLCRI